MTESFKLLISDYIITSNYPLIFATIDNYH